MSVISGIGSIQSPIDLEVVEGEFHDDHRIGEAVAECQTELLVARIGRAPGEDTLLALDARDRPALERGATVRTLLQHTARHNASIAAHVERLTAAGAEVRTMSEFFSESVIVDRRIAFITVDNGRRGVAAVRHPVLVAYLADLFDYVWKNADPYLAHTTQNITTPLQDLVIRMLVDGETGRVIAKRLGISDRTLAKRITRLKDDYHAHTTFQLGYQIALHQRQPRP